MKSADEVPAKIEKVPVRTEEATSCFYKGKLGCGLRVAKKSKLSFATPLACTNFVSAQAKKDFTQLSDLENVRGSPVYQARLAHASVLISLICAINYVTQISQISTDSDFQEKSVEICVICVTQEYCID